VLIKNQANQIQNGVYTLTNNGSAGVTAWILTSKTMTSKSKSSKTWSRCSGFTLMLVTTFWLGFKEIKQ
jgi:hypothetical protein